MKTPFVIGVSGKGGTGKTTIASLLTRCLIERGIRPVLAVDADPNANFNEALGIEVHETLGSMREDAFLRSIPPGMTRNEYIALRFRQVLIEGEGFDLIAMGRPEGQGCYCFANDLLTKAMYHLEREYQAIIVDNEAGMEHFARGTIGMPDVLLIITDPGARGVRTAERIRTIGTELGMRDEQMRIIVNRVHEETNWYHPIQEPFALIPADPNLEAADLNGLPVSGISSDSPAFRAVCTLVDRLLVQE